MVVAVALLLRLLLGMRSAGQGGAGKSDEHTDGRTGTRWRRTDVQKRRIPAKEAVDSGPFSNDVTSPFAFSATFSPLPLLPRCHILHLTMV